MVKRSIAIKCDLPNRRECDVKVDANGTIKDLKDAILAVAGEGMGVKSVKDFRILQRSMELNEKGTLLYYHITDPTTVQVVKKLIPAASHPSPLPGGGGGAEYATATTSNAGYNERPQEGFQHHSTAGGQQPPLGGSSYPAMGGVPKSGGQPPRPPSAASGRSAVKSSSSPSGGPQRPQSAVPAAGYGGRGPSPAPLGVAVYGTGFPGGHPLPNSYDSRAQAPPGTTAAGYRVVIPPPPSYASTPAAGYYQPAEQAYPTTYAAAGATVSDDDEEESAMVRRLEAGIAALQRDVGSSYAAASRSGGDAAGSMVNGSAESVLMQQKVLALEQRLRSTESKYGEALERITELESTIRRYQQLLRKMSSGGGGVV